MILTFTNRPSRTQWIDDQVPANPLAFQVCRRAVPWGRHHHFGKSGGGKPPPYGSLFVQRIIGGRSQIAPTAIVVRSVHNSAQQIRSSSLQCQQLVNNGCGGAAALAQRIVDRRAGVAEGKVV